MSEAFVRFAADGDPNHPDKPASSIRRPPSGGRPWCRRRRRMRRTIPRPADQGALRQVHATFVTAPSVEQGPRRVRPHHRMAGARSRRPGGADRAAGRGGGRPGGSTLTGTANCCRCTSAATGSTRPRPSRLSMSGFSTSCSAEGGIRVPRVHGHHDADPKAYVTDRVPGRADFEGESDEMRRSAMKDYVDILPADAQARRGAVRPGWHHPGADAAAGRTSSACAISRSAPTCRRRNDLIRSSSSPSPGCRETRRAIPAARP